MYNLLLHLLIQGHFPLAPIYCLVWICLDVFFCTASIMHLCAISIDRYLSLRYTMKYGHNKSRIRIFFKIFFVWLLSMMTCLPLVATYSKVMIVYSITYFKFNHRIAFSSNHTIKIF